MRGDSDVGSGVAFGALGGLVGGMQTPADEMTVVWAVDMGVCRLCLDGAAGECHVPGCAFWMRDAPSAELASLLRAHTAIGTA